MDVMKIKDFFKKIKPFASVAASYIPGGPAVVAALNMVLPDDQKLSEAATGSEILSRYDSLDSAAKQSVMEKEIDLEMAEIEGFTERYKAMCAADGQSTRPEIAKVMAWMLAIPYVLIGMSIFYAIVSGEAKLEDMWQTLLAYLGIPLTLLRAYFGILEKEQGNRLGAEKRGLMDELAKVLPWKK
jgi:hypothetical protein